LRAIRFAIQLNFNISSDTLSKSTYCAILNKSSKLCNISKERIRDEFNKILLSEYSARGLEYLNEFLLMQYICPEFLDTLLFNQCNKYHIYDIGEHIIKSVSNIIENDLILKLTMFFHDIGKPQCFTKDENGIGHFYGHSEISAQIAGNTMKKLKYDNDMITTVCLLVKYHDYDPETKKNAIKRFVNKIGVENFDKWYKVKIADILAQNLQYASERLEKLFEVKQLFTEIQNNQECFSYKDLAVNGEDIMKSLQIKQGKEVGVILKEILDKVIDGELENDNYVILKYLEKKVR
jgi:tRNA nucleotidyltransferase (CCA-adding enzyme)